MSCFLYSPVMESGGYQIANSVRLRASASAYLSRTPASAGNQRTWTWSGWVKLGALGVINSLFSANPTSGGTFCYFDTDGTIHLTVNTGAVEAFVSSARFRDPSAWYHIVVACDTTQATVSNRISVWVSNQQIAPQSTANFPSQNLLTAINSANLHRLGSWNDTIPNYFYSDSYRADHYLIDGQALDPSYFGTTNSDGVWTPKAYSGTYGTNGFYLDFKDGSSLTNLCLDRSGNGNNWTASGMSLTAGPTYDLMKDTATDNHCTLSPLSKTSGALDLSAANLRLSASGGAFTRCNSTLRVSSGKWYYEVPITSLGTNSSVGIGQGDITDQYPGQDALSYAFDTSAARTLNNNVQPTYGVALTTNDILQVAFDLDNNKVFFGKNGTWMASSDPATGANPAYNISAGTYGPIARPYSSGVLDFNFGQRPFTYTPPTGYKALCTANRGTGSITTSGSFTGSANADGPCIWLNGNPESMTINGNAVTWGTHADKLAGGFKVRTASASYNASGSNTYSVTVTGKLFGDLAHAPNTAKGNP